ncbi:MAG: hypothetical protein JRJ75_13230 [Deltaproteobacteria bacterium]|nr:hypothetical protein [Deltaproteobacteria bacterium]MBW1931042.1 hypothetical protein [Deltaproteobacteria bacterium]MBW2026384.1 hypothetical protein [Deltaproteobacteria bacterium]
MTLFERKGTPSQVLRETILSFPSFEFRKGRVWQIGNVTKFDEHGIYFRVGRTSKSTLEVYRDGNFVDQQFDAAPYTHVLVDIQLELCAIARKSRLSPKPKGIAMQLARVLNQSSKAKEFGVRFEILEINDPHDFVTYIRSAYNITRFWISFSLPNIFDTDDFIKPMERLLKETSGESGKTELKGDSLNPEKLEALSRSAASTGDDAGAMLQLEKDKKRVRKSLKGNPVTLTQEELSNQEQMLSLLRQMREIYEKIRGMLGKKDER